jgi:para-aminobenzoate synthetase/4-amino-4-deoxychorismate lyase
VVFLDTALSARGHRRSLLFTAPTRIIRADRQDEVMDAVREVDRLSRKHWLAGFMAYEAGYAFEPRLQPLAPARVDCPLVWFGVYDSPYVFDHERGRWTTRRPPGTRSGREASTPLRVAARLKSGLSYREYAYALSRIKRYIAGGHTYQVNYTFDESLQTSAGSWRLYRWLRRKQRVPFSAYMATGDVTVLSFSPELFFSFDRRRVRVKPMKGTARRGRSEAEDRAVREGLAADVKNRAENVMIVDLLRNDIGRICRMGSVSVERLFEVETHLTLHQMTSTVVGTLKPRVAFSDIVRAIFPSGSVTGAPKIRTMEIIRSLERGTRGVYCGAIGYLSPGRGGTFSVPIRTLQRTSGRRHWRYRVGSGIVWDSTTPDEWRECDVKTSFLTRQAPQFELFESILWSKRLVYMREHTDRLRRSLAYFGGQLRAPELGNIRSAIERVLRNSRRKHKVRILAGLDGDLRWDSVPIDDPPRGSVPVAVLSRQHTDSSEPLLYHKTTHRPWYRQATKQIRAGRCYDVIYTNERGEVSEGARSNVFVRLGGRLYTPPVSSGLLPGVLRRRMLARGSCSERVLTVRDLRRAQAIYCGNSVRGLVRVALTYDSA